MARANTSTRKRRVLNTSEIANSVSGRGTGRGKQKRAGRGNRESGIIVNPTATKRFFTPLRLLLEDAILDEPYRQHSWTYAAIRAQAMNIANVPFRILTGDEENPTVVREGPWVDLFDRVNPIMQSRSQLWEAIVIWLALSGECTIVKEGKGNEPIRADEIPSELWPMNGLAFEPIVDKRTKLPVGWFTIDPVTNERIPFELGQIARVKYYNPYAPLRGLAPWQAASASVRSDFKAVRFNEAFFDNDAMPGGFIKVDGMLTKEQRDELRKGHEDRHQGQDKRRRMGVLEAGMEWVAVGDSLRDMEFTGLRTFSREEILAIFKVPESEVSLLSNVNFATALSSDRGFWTKTLVPIMRLIEDTLWTQVFNVKTPSVLRNGVDRRRSREGSWVPQNRGPSPDNMPFIPGVEDERPDSAGTIPGQFWGEFDLSAIESLRQNLDLKLASAQRMIQLGYTLNQVNERLELGMEEVAWGDIPFAPPGGIPVEQIILPPDVDFPAPDDEPPTDTTPGNAEPSAPSESTPADGLSGLPEEGRVIKKVGDEWCVFSEDGKKLGCHPTKKKAQEQLNAVEASKAGRTAVKGLMQRVAQLKQNPKQAARWTRVVKTSMDPFEPRFRSRFRRYLFELRGIQLKRLQVAAKLKAGGEELETSEEELPRSMDWRGVDMRAPSPFDPQEAQKIVFDLERASQRIQTVHHPLYVQITDMAMTQQFSELGGNFAFDVTDPRVVDVIAEREAILANVPKNMQKGLARSLEAGIRNGESIAELADRIRVEFNRIGGSRSFTVARTEVASTTNASRFTVMEEEGVSRHQWITARDEAVRATHRAQNGTKRDIGQPFPNQLIHPNDPNGAPGEVINCRCIAVAL